MKWKVDKSPETFAEGAKVRAIHPVEVYHINKVLQLSDKEY
jgi:hypothetical protein